MYQTVRKNPTRMDAWQTKRKILPNHPSPHRLDHGTLSHRSRKYQHPLPSPSKLPTTTTQAHDASETLAILTTTGLSHQDCAPTSSRDGSDGRRRSGCLVVGVVGVVVVLALVLALVRSILAGVADPKTQWIHRTGGSGRSQPVVERGVATRRVVRHGTQRRRGEQCCCAACGRYC